MMKLVFYWGPGDLVTKVIRLLTNGPYSHVELQFTDGCRFFASGHGLLQGSQMVCDKKVYDHWWDKIFLPATTGQEKAAEAYAFTLVGMPFDWRGMVSFLLPFVSRKRAGIYCSSVVLDVLQQRLHLFPQAQLKVSPNGLYRLFMRDPERVIVRPLAPEPA
jgi:hypothetical protein